MSVYPTICWCAKMSHVSVNYLIRIVLHNRETSWAFWDLTQERLETVLIVWHLGDDEAGGREGSPWEVGWPPRGRGGPESAFGTWLRPRLWNLGTEGRGKGRPLSPQFTSIQNIKRPREICLNILFYKVFSNVTSLFLSLVWYFSDANTHALV